ncbi:MAG: LytR C-terminal domain-containing protein [Actinomycetota bacterium]|nr:LytR C-terminal domain-containing protein [Actinomycetota bacterium]
MTSLRESPIKRPRRGRPPWLLPVLIAVAAIVVIGLVFAVVRLVGSGSDEASPAAPGSSPSPCVTTMVIPADVLPAANRVRVNVYNATEVAGLAGRAAKELGARDFQVVKISNDPLEQKIPGVAQIRYGPKGAASAQVLAFQVPGAELVEDTRKGRTVDLAMGEEFAGLAPVEEITAMMIEPTPSASGTGCPVEG